MESFQSREYLCVCSRSSVKGAEDDQWRGRGQSGRIIQRINIYEFHSDSRERNANDAVGRISKLRDNPRHCCLCAFEDPGEALNPKIIAFSPVVIIDKQILLTYASMFYATGNFSGC